MPSFSLRAAASRARWVAVGTLVVLWFVAMALNVGGSWAHLLLVGAIGVLVYELLTSPPDAAR